MKNPFPIGYLLNRLTCPKIGLQDNSKWIYQYNNVERDSIAPGLRERKQNTNPKEVN